MNKLLKFGRSEFTQILLYYIDIYITKSSKDIRVSHGRILCSDVHLSGQIAYY